jgi:hypothetical protein
MKCKWTKHASERQKQWHVILGISREEIEEIVLNPAQVVPGDIKVQIAQTKIGGGLLRVPFIKENDDRKILTVYWTSKIDKYWRKTSHEDKI